MVKSKTMGKWKEIKKHYFGDAQFYRKVLFVAIPLIIQQLITSFVNMLDNIMVGQTGTLQMSGVSIANQLNLIFNLAVFGSVSGAGIFGAQFAGKEDWEGVRHTLRYKLLVEILITIIGMGLFLGFGQSLISLFMNTETNAAADIVMTTGYAMDYLKIMTIGFLPFALSQCISSAIRETGETRLPMVASVTAVLVNFVGNWILIFGHFGAPALGSSGAAIATVISRFAELAVILFFAIYNRDRFPFFHDLLKGFSIPKDLAKEITFRGPPLVLNEVIWAMGIAAITQCYSVRGIDALAAYNIASTITNLFFVFNIAMGDCISILVGQKLGAGLAEEAVDTDRKLLVFTTILSTLLGLGLFFTADLFPGFYNTTDAIRGTAAQLMRIGGLCMPISALYNSCYFTMRCGGKTVITFLFDSFGTLVVSFPVALMLSRLTALPVTTMYLIVTLVDLYKVILGLFLVHKRIWVNDLVS